MKGGYYTNMKKIKSYSLNEETITRVSTLANALGVSDSSIVELLVRVGYQGINDSVLKELLVDTKEGEEL